MIFDEKCTVVSIDEDEEHVTLRGESGATARVPLAEVVERFDWDGKPDPEDYDDE